jgi:hypothetical protein
VTRTDIIRELIRLGERSHAYWDQQLPRRHPKYPLIQPGEDSGPPPPEDAEIQQLLNTLPERDLYILLTLMYVGRGDFDLHHFKSGYRKMKDSFPSRDLVIDQMTGTQVLSEYLADALEEIEQSHLNVDSPSFEASVAS